MDAQVIRSVDKINNLARALHGGDGQAHAYTFRSLAEHVDEVQDLLGKRDPHWKAETMDIIIHGLTLLRREGVSGSDMDQLMAGRLARFQEKISSALGKDKEKSHA